jgi:hypothetical protein
MRSNIEDEETPLEASMRMLTEVMEENARLQEAKDFSYSIVREAHEKGDYDIFEYATMIEEMFNKEDE